jgi:hypothetical protein
VIEAIEETPPPASASKTPATEDATATKAAPAEAKTAEDINLEGTFSDIDKMLLNMAAEEAATAADRDGNGYPKPETRWVFTLLGDGYGLISKPTGFLMGDKLNPAGTRVRVWDPSTHTRKPMGF